MRHLTQPWPVRAGRSSWLVAAALCLALLGGLALLDQQVSLFGQGLPQVVVAVFAWITDFGESAYILIAALVAFIVFGGLAAMVRERLARLAYGQLARVSAFIFAGVGLPGLFTAVVKRIIGRARPVLLDSVGSLDFQTLNWFDWTHQSFPSGHTTTAFAACFAIGFLAPRAYPWLLGIATLIGISRIVVGAHYPTDLVAGAVVGTLGAYLVRNLFADRRWVFTRRADGAVAMRPLVAVRRLQRARARKRRASLRPHP